MSASCPSELCLPSGWSRREVATSASSQREVFYRSPSGLLYSTPRAVLAHMRNEGSYTRDQVKQFRVEVERWQDSRGQAKEGREGCVEQQVNIHTSNDPWAKENMKKKIMDALSGGRSDVNKKPNNTNKASELENVLKSLKAKKKTSSKRKTEGEESVFGNTGPERKRVKMSLNMSVGKVDQELEQKQYSPFVFSSPSQGRPVPLDDLPVDETATQFQCNTCEREYSHKRTMLMHVKIKHRESETSKNDIAANVAPPKRGHGHEKKQTVEDAKKKIPQKFHKEICSSPMSPSLPTGLNSGPPNVWSLRTDAERPENLPVDETANQFQCNMCDRGYSHKRTLLMHVKKKHRENETSKNDIAPNVAPPKRGHVQEKKQTVEDAKKKIPKKVHKEKSSSALKIKSNSPMSPSLCTGLNSGLPNEWSLRTEAGRPVYRKPGCHQLEGRVQALAHMLENGCAPEDMFQLWSSLEEEGWVVEDSLPTGWRKRTTEDGNEEFLSPMMEVFPRKEAFLQFVLSRRV